MARIVFFLQLIGLLSIASSSAYKPALYLVKDEFHPNRHSRLVLGHPRLANESGVDEAFLASCGTSLDPTVNSLVLDSISDMVNVKFLDESSMNRLVSQCTLWYPSPRGMLVFPSTKWCGVGNHARADNELGTSWATDACCQEHDSCSDYIAPMSRREQLLNPSPIYKSNCRCDDKLYSCLKQAAKKEATAAVVGRIYFNVLKIKCFVKDCPLTCVKKSGWIPGFRRCEKYEKDCSSSPEYQYVDPKEF